MLPAVFSRFLRFLVEVLCLDRFAGNPQLQNFDLLLAIENLIRKENFRQYTNSPKADSRSNRENHNRPGSKKRFHDHAADAGLRQRLLWLIPGHIARVADLVEYLVRGLSGGSSHHNRDKGTDSLAK